MPLNYPRGCTDAQILETLERISAELLRSGAQINRVLQLSPLITIGQLELQARLADRSSREMAVAMGQLQNAVGEFKKSSDRASKALIRLTVVLVVLTVVLVGLTVAVLVR
jgi:hypothetical protein